VLVGVAEASPTEDVLGGVPKGGVVDVLDEEAAALATAGWPRLPIVKFPPLAKVLDVPAGAERGIVTDFWKVGVGGDDACIDEDVAGDKSDEAEFDVDNTGRAVRGLVIPVVAGEILDGLLADWGVVGVFGESRLLGDC